MRARRPIRAGPAAPASPSTTRRMAQYCTGTSNPRPVSPTWRQPRRSGTHGTSIRSRPTSTAPAWESGACSRSSGTGACPSRSMRLARRSSATPRPRRLWRRRARTSSITAGVDHALKSQPTSSAALAAIAGRIASLSEAARPWVKTTRIMARPLASST